jgi:hypothetical protein
MKLYVRRRAMTMLIIVTLAGALTTPPATRGAFGQAGATDTPVTDTWDIRVLNSGMTDLEGKPISADTITKIDDIIKLLNDTYKIDKNGIDPVRLARSKLYLYAPPATLLSIKRDLVKLDALGPQVQLDVSAIQISGKGAALEKQINQINTSLIDGRQLIQKIHGIFQGEVVRQYAEFKAPSKERNPAYREQDDITRELLDSMQAVGLDTNAIRGMTFSETLLFLSALPSDLRRAVFDRAEHAIVGLLRDAQGTVDAKEPPLLAEVPADAVGRYDKRTRAFNGDGSPLRELRSEFGVPKLEWLQSMDAVAAEEASGVKVAQQTLKQFLKTLRVYQTPANDIRGNTERLLSQADIMDNYHAGLASAYARDVQRSVVTPLIAAIQQKINSRADGNGSVALLGQTRLVVTSGLETSLKPTLTSAADVTQPSAMTVDEAKTAQEAVASIISGLTGSQAFAVGALLKPQPRAFATIAPGIGISVRPTVLPNAAAARLQILASFGVAAAMPERETGSDNPQPPVLDAVESHLVRTDANIDALDLVGLSSLSTDTRVPRGPFVFPVLGRLPVLGPIFQFSRKDTRIHHYSIILVNTVILPRALDIARNYAGMQPGTQ